MELKPLFTITATIGKMDAVGVGSKGNRMIAEVTGGEFEGDRMSGQILSPGADWLIATDDGFNHLDVRLTLQTNDGAVIYMYYTGVLEMNEVAQKAMAGESEMQFGDNYFFTQPRFETGHESYQWLNNLIAVAQGRLVAGSVQYQVFECAC